MTGYLRQEDDEFAGWEALIVHLLGGGSNHVMLEVLQEKPRVKSAVANIYRRFTRKQVRYNACGMNFLQVSWNYKMRF